MYGLSAIDPGRDIDWGRTSQDYAEWRPDYPPEFYERLAGSGIGLPGQRILDLGTGVGFLALQFARCGSVVTGIDVSEGQIRQARDTATAQKLAVEFAVAPAEATGLPPATFDVITASQCWLYFDRERAIAEVRRLLKAGGVLMLSHFCWLPRRDDIARRSEELVLQFNPQWSAADWSGEIPHMPDWAAGRFERAGGFVFDAPVAFTRESWRGRFRACRGVGAALPADEVARFDAAHAELLEATVPTEFTVLHRIDCVILRPVGHGES